MQLREPEAIRSKPLQSDKTRQTSDVLKLSGEWSRILHKRLRRGFFWRLAKRLLHFSVEVKLSEKQLPKIQAHTHGLCSKQARCFFCSFPKIWYDFKPSGTAKTARFGTLSNRRYHISRPISFRRQKWQTSAPWLQGLGIRSITVSILLISDNYNSRLTTIIIPDWRQL